jgi:hypothetical protein
VAYQTVQVDPATDGRAALIRLWTQNLPVHGDVEAKLRWTYLDPPQGRAEAFVLRVSDTGDDATDVGCAGVSRRELWHRGTALRAALLGDLAIDAKHRTALPALTLQRAVKRHVEADYDLSYGFPNDKAVALHKRTGYHELGIMKRYVRVLRHRGHLERRYGRPALTRLAAAVIDPALGALALGRAIRPAATHALRWLSDFDERFDRLWAAAQADFPIACRRDSTFLRWRFLRKPDERNAIAALVHRRTGAIAAYAVIRGDAGGAAEIGDLFGERLEAIDALLSMLVPALYLRGFTTAVFRYLGPPRVAALLAKHRFSQREGGRVIIVSPTARCPIGPEVRDAGAWYLTDLDEDT